MNQTVNIVLLCISALLPALIVFAVCMWRIESTRGDSADIKTQLSTSAENQTRIIMQHHEYVDKLATITAELHACDIKIQGLDEGLASVNNKLASRERSDRQALKKMMDSVSKDETEIPGTKQEVLDLSKLGIPLPVHNSPAPAPPSNNQRPFGVYPDGW